MEELFRNLFLWLSANTWLRRMTTQLPIARQIAACFVAGETAGEAVSAVREQKKNRRGFGRGGKRSRKSGRR